MGGGYTATVVPLFLLLGHQLSSIRSVQSVFLDSAAKAQSTPCRASEARKA
jgi:hypothetical protein